MKDKLTFTLFTPHQTVEPIECDSVRLSVADSVSGEFSGCYGIRKGHARTILALAAGKISVSNAGEEIYSAECDSGFAIVENNVVRVTADSVK